jgi:hypothetical protein
VFGIHLKSLQPIGVGPDLVVHLRRINPKEVFNLRAGGSRFLRGLKMLARLIGLVRPQLLEGLSHFSLHFGRKRVDGHRGRGIFRGHRSHLDGDLGERTFLNLELPCRRLVLGGQHLNSVLRRAHAIKPGIAVFRGFLINECTV